jgi:hypothetical protein
LKEHSRDLRHSKNPTEGSLFCRTYADGKMVLRMGDYTEKALLTPMKMEAYAMDV